MERQHRGGRRNGADGFHGAADLAFAGQEAEDVAVGLRERAADRGGHRHRAEVAHVDREHAAFGAHRRRVAEMGGDGVRVKRGGHDEDSEVRSERASHLEREREGEVAGERPLVELVEDDEPGVGKLRVREDALREQALGHDLQPGARGDPALEPHLVADGLAQLLAAAAGDVCGAAARGEAPRLEHDDLAATEPGRVDERRRDAGGLAASRRRGENDAAVGRQGRSDLADLLFDGKRHRTDARIRT